MMFYRCPLFGVVLLLVSVAPVWAQYQDRTEYELASHAYRETDPKLRLVLLRDWTAAFPTSRFRQERFNEMIVAEQRLGLGNEMWKTAEKMAADDPSGVGNYWITVLTIGLQNSSPQGLAQGRRAATALLRNLSRSFAIEHKPESVDTGAWYRERDRQGVLARRTLGWIALQLQNWAEAEKLFSEVLRASPGDAEVSYWLGVTLLGTKLDGRRDAALYHFARSLAVTGDGALLPAARRLVDPYFETTYVRLYGNRNGLPGLLKKAATTPFPPNRF